MVAGVEPFSDLLQDPSVSARFTGGRMFRLPSFGIVKCVHDKVIL